MFSKECKLHLEQAKMSRYQHFKHANQISWRLFMASFAAFIHAFAPRYFKTSATDTCIAIARENNKIQTKYPNVFTSNIASDASTESRTIDEFYLFFNSIIPKQIFIPTASITITFKGSLVIVNQKKRKFTRPKYNKYPTV